jgi:hypothetical protein
MTAPGGGGVAAKPGAGEARATRLRMAGIHLRMGSLLLARAELEALAGRGALDEEALVDLAEARWRTGDLAGAGEAADALLATGSEDALALVIAAEAVAAAGRPGEARRLAGRALTAVDGPLEGVFAGMPRSLIWPSDTVAGAAHSPDLAEPGEPIAVRAATAPTPGAGVRPAEEAAPGADATASPVASSSAAAEAFAGGMALLARGENSGAAVRLAVALRLDPGFAAGVLEAVGADAVDPSLALVAGDALRLLGRETQAFAAFHRARQGTR